MRHGCQHHKNAHGAAPFTRPGAEKHYPPDLRVEPVHMHLDLFLDLHGQTLRGRNTLRVRGNGGTGDTLELNAVGFDAVRVRPIEALPSDDVPPSAIDRRECIEGPPSVDDAPVLQWRYDGDRVHITWPTPLADGEEREVVVDYRVTRPNAGLYFSRPTDADPTAPWYAATDNETERARHWMPCVDLPSVRPTLSFSVRARDTMTILANGYRTGEDAHDDGTKTVHWRLDQRCPSYITCVAVGDFVEVVDDSFGEIPVTYYATREFSEDDLRRSFGRTPEMLAWMTEKLGVPFPYPKYAQFALPGFGGAMENISLVSWDDIFVMDASLATEWTRLVDQVNVHEMAHSYFGDLVVCRDFAHAWLKESWATYMEVCWFEDRLGRDEADYEFYSNAGAYFFEADKRYTRPIVTREFNSSWQMYDAHLYPGGACRLHMLRHLLGDDAFWRGVKNYLESRAGRTVETDDFRHALENASGRSLGRFFDQWIHGKGYPNLDVSFEWKSASQLGIFTIEQKQVDADAGVPAFDLDIELGWVIDGELKTESVRLDAKKGAFSFRMEKDPEQVRIDPSAKLLARWSFNPGDDKLRRQLKDAGDVIGRIRAAAELVLTGKRVNVEAVTDAYMEEPFWGVRLEMARELAHARNIACREGLLAVLAFEKDPLVLHKLFAAAAEVRDPRVRAVIEQRIEGSLPHRAKKAAYEALGAQRADAPVDQLVAASAQRGFGGIVQSGALNALGNTRTEAARQRLLEAVRPGATNDRARPAAATALGELGAYLEKPSPARAEVIDALVDRLLDPSDRVRAASARALATMNAVEAIGAIETWADTLSAQEKVMTLRLVDRIREAARATPTGKSDEITSLRDKIAKLEDLVDTLKARFDAHVGEGEGAAALEATDGGEPERADE